MKYDDIRNILSFFFVLLGLVSSDNWFVLCFATVT